MKIGDLVQIIGSFSDDNPEVTSLLGTLVQRSKLIPHWWEVLASTGEIIDWPEGQMSVINESR